MRRSSNHGARPVVGRVGRSLIAGAIVFAASMAGCHTKPQPVERRVLLHWPGIGAIALRYEKVIEDLRNSASETWHHDWTGNIVPNMLGGRHKGLCFEWQERVWAGIAETVRRVGWRGVGLAANRDHWTEHHVVVVYDPSRTSVHDLLVKPTAAGDLDDWTPKPGPTTRGAAWVLDPWHTGTPMVYTMDEWLTHGTAEWFTVELEGMGGATLDATVGR